MRRYCLAILVPLLLAAGGCNNPSLNKTLENQANEIKTLRSDVDDLKSQIELNKMVQDWDQIAYLTPGSRGYSPVRTDLGAITVSLDDVQPYGNGTKIKLRFGNTTDAILDGVKAKVEYGTVDEKGVPDNEHARSTPIDVLKPLYAGSWTSEDVILEGVPPTGLGFVRVRDFKTDHIRLR